MRRIGSAIGDVLAMLIVGVFFVGVVIACIVEWATGQNDILGLE